jgi:hypothetical protein
MGPRRTALAASAACVLALGVAASAEPPADTARRANAQRVDAQAQALLPRPALAQPTTVTLTPARPVLKLDLARDYVVRVEPGAVFTEGAAIVGGRNVVLEGAAIRYAAPAGVRPGWHVRGLLLKGQTGVMWVHGLELRGPLGEGIDLDQRAPGVAVVLRNVTVDPVRGHRATNHADVLQSWAGPAKLVVDQLTGTSNYQGMFLVPDDECPTCAPPEFFWLRGVHLDVSAGSYGLWTKGGDAYPVVTHNVTVRHNPLRRNRDLWLWPKPSTGDKTWTEVQAKA